MEAWLVDALAATGYRGFLDRGLRPRPTGDRRCDARRHRRRRVARAGRPRASVRRPLGAARRGLRRRVRGDARLGFTPRQVTGRRSCPARSRERTSRRRVRLGAAAASPAHARVAVQGGFLIWAFYASQPYLLELLGSDAVWVAGLVSGRDRAVDDRGQPGRPLRLAVLRKAHDAAARRRCRRVRPLPSCSGSTGSFWVALAACSSSCSPSA